VGRLRVSGQIGRRSACFETGIETERLNAPGAILSC
jgi:hypothetical protein